MVSERQIAANRINAKRSTGPKTELGKRRSSRNALRHGLLSKFVVLPTESEDEYNEFSREIAQDLAPIGALESLLADRIAAAAWRLRRACSIEAGMLSLEYYGVLISDAQARARSATRSNPLFLPLEEVEVVDPVEHGLALEEEGAARVLQSSDRERIGNAYQLSLIHI